MARPKGSKNKKKVVTKVDELVEVVKETPPIAQVEVDTPPDNWVYLHRAANDPKKIVRSLTRDVGEGDGAAKSFFAGCPKKFKTYELVKKIYGRNPLEFLGFLFKEADNPDILFEKISQNTTEALRPFYDDILAIAVGMGDSVSAEGTKDVAITLAMNVACNDGTAEITIAGLRSNFGS